MPYNEIKPGKALEAYVKCYYIYQSESDTTFEDTVFPSGCVEIIFNLGTGVWQTAKDDQFITTPPIELWGQIIRPLSVRSQGRNTMLGVRFFPHAAAFFLNDKVDLFNDQVTDFAAAPLHDRLLDTTSWGKRIELVESYLLQKLSQSQKRFTGIRVVCEIMHELQHKDFFDNIDNVASRYGITSRYLQKLFLQYTGLTPKLYSKINRFQNSLKLVTSREESLTSIAYTCGYFDQSHFIREFKSFTNLTPNKFRFLQSELIQAD